MLYSPPETVTTGLQYVQHRYEDLEQMLFQVEGPSIMKRSPSLSYCGCKGFITNYLP
jgi:hypothetical protein